MPIFAFKGRDIFSYGELHSFMCKHVSSSKLIEDSLTVVFTLIKEKTCTVIQAFRRTMIKPSRLIDTGTSSVLVYK